jgi:hypothetical protein
MHGTGSGEGRRADAFVGISFAEGEKPATLDEALRDAAEQAGDGYIDRNLRVLDIEFVPGNPHIKELRVMVTPGG